MWLFRILFAIDVAGLLVLLFFFAESQRGTYVFDQGSSIYWLLALAVTGGAMVWAWSLMKRGRVGAANALLGVPAAPCALALFVVGWFSFFPLHIQ